MNIRFHVACFGMQLLLTQFGVLPSASAQASAPGAVVPPVTLTSEQVVAKLVQRNIERARALTAYHGSRVYRVEYHGLIGSKTAEMTVAVDYHAPDTKEFKILSETGSRLLVDRVLHKLLETEKEAQTEENRARTALNTANYRFTLLGAETIPTGPCYKLSVEPLTRDKLLYRGRIWVDANDFAVVRIEGEPAKNPSFWIKETAIEQAYAKVGDFWLPLSNRSVSAIRLGGRATFSIDYRDYRITAVTPQGGSTTLPSHRP